MEIGNLLIGYIVVGVLGGSLLTTVIQKIFDRKKDASSIRLSEGDQTLKWSEKALQIIDELIETKRRLADCEERCRECDVKNDLSALQKRSGPHRAFESGKVLEMRKGIL